MIRLLLIFLFCPAIAFADFCANLCLNTEGSMGGVSFEFYDRFGGYGSFASWQENGVSEGTLNLGVTKRLKQLTVCIVLGAYETFSVTRQVGLFKDEPDGNDVAPMPKYTWTQRWQYGIGINLAYAWRYFVAGIKYMWYQHQALLGFSFGIHVEQGL